MRCAAIIFLISFQCLGTNYYLDPNAAGTGTGLSWANAYTTIAAVNAAHVAVAVGGNTLYIHGATPAQVYTHAAQGNLSLSTSSASAVNKFTISIGVDVGHNGRAVLDGNFACTNGCQVGHFTTITGDNGNGTTNLVFANFLTATNASRDNNGTAISIGIAAWALMDHLEITNCGNGIIASGATNTEIRFCNLNAIWADYGIRCNAYYGTNFQNFQIHDNTILTYADNIGSSGGPDAMQVSGGATICSNKCICVPGPVNAGQHPDGVQNDGNYVKIFANYFANFINSGWKPNPFQSTWVENYFFNNVVVMDNANFLSNSTVNYKGVEPGWITTPLPTTNILIANNTFVDLPGLAVNGGQFTYQTPTVNFCIENNLVVNCGTANGATLVAGIRGDGVNCLWDYNLLYKASAGSTNSELIADNDGTTVYVQAHGVVGAVSFTSYTPYNPANDYHLSAADTAASGKGVNFSSFFTTDKDGLTRSAWDIGAFAFTAVGTALKSTVSGQVSITGRVFQ